MIKHEKFSEFVEYDNLSLEYDKVTHNIDEQTDIEYALDVIFQYHREIGFPHYTVHEHKKQSDLRSLKNFDEQSIFKDKKVDQTMHGLSLAWSYHPHWVDVACGSQTESPIERWNDDKVLKTVIRKTWKWQLKHGNGTFTLNRLRQNFKIYGAAQTVSNFRPSAAKYIYNTYGNKNGVIYDPSMGWGGRMLGFLSSDCKKYIGTDPSTKTFTGILKMKNELNISNKEIELHNLGSEIFRPKYEELDLVFTSPPYFDTERYADEPSQSYNQFPTMNNWVNGFLRKTFENCFYGLKPGRFMLINIANTIKYKNIETDTIGVAVEIGFEHIETIYLILSSVSGKGQKTEPIFIFKKP